MAEPEVPKSASPEPDVEMTTGENLEAEDDGVGGPATHENGEPQNPQSTFLDHLKSPIVELLVGSGDEASTVTAHQSLLAQSPFLAEKLADLTGSARRLELPDETLDAVGCFLQYQYTGEYFPRRLPSSADGLERDPTVPAIDETGSQLLKHARVYSLAEKFGMSALKTLAHSKIHKIDSTAVAEIAYARYVYQNISPKDVTIRKPVAAFWATRSHVLRHEAEDEFRAMCLEYPQFGFDVLSLVLDQKEKRSSLRDEDTPVKGSSRKRMRPSIHI